MKLKRFMLCLNHTSQSGSIPIEKAEGYSSFNQNENDTPVGKSYKRINRDDESVLPIRHRSGIVGHPVDTTVLKKIIKYPKTKSDEELIIKSLTNNDFLQHLLDLKLLQAIVDGMYSREVKSGEVLISQGSIGKHLYVSSNGKFEIKICDKLIKSFNDNRVFGELAILYNVKCQATIKALSSGSVWVLDQSVYKRIILNSEIKHCDQLLNILRKVPKLNVASDEVLRKVADLLKLEFFETDQVIIREGDRGDKFHIINAGTVTITKYGEQEVINMGRGGFFGHLALLQDVERQATVTAVAPGVECLSLSRSEFIEYFGNIKSLTDIPDASLRKSTSPNISPYENIHFYDLKVIGTLGVGAFGKVELVQHKEHENLIFACKRIKKIDVIEREQQDYVFNEKKIQKRCSNIFIVNLYKTYRDDRYLYFLMEACMGGDLCSLLENQEGHRLKEYAARFYAASVLEALTYLHERNIIYRDLKPENVMLNTHGYLKLTDFGSAKRLGPQGKTYTFIGTPEYLAPEMILNRGHDRSLDFWTLGIFIFELLAGSTPFRNKHGNDQIMLNSILSGIKEVTFPSFIKSTAENLIRHLCKANAIERLGCQNTGADAIRNHKWFVDFDWNKLRSCELEAPIIRNIKNNTDMRYFGNCKRRASIVPPNELSGWDKDF